MVPAPRGSMLRARKRRGTARAIIYDDRARGILSVEDELARRGVRFWSRARPARSVTARSALLAERRLGSELKNLVR